MVKVQALRWRRRCDVIESNGGGGDYITAVTAASGSGQLGWSFKSSCFCEGSNGTCRRHILLRERDHSAVNLAMELLHNTTVGPLAYRPEIVPMLSAGTHGRGQNGARRWFAFVLAFVIGVKEKVMYTPF